MKLNWDYTPKMRQVVKQLNIAKTMERGASNENQKEIYK